MRQIAKRTSMLIFGVIVPLAVLVQAYFTLRALADEVNYAVTPEGIVTTFSKAKQSIANGNDYALFSLLYSEHANQKTMANKQVMKVSVMQIGFAVTSIGIMFILLGINDGGVVGTGSVSGASFDFKTGSTGAFIFLAGALMSTAGGVLKNEYNSVPMPEYVFSNISGKQAASINAYNQCKKQSEVEEFHKCFIDLFEKVNQGTLK